jgi:phage gp29-like protein
MDENNNAYFRDAVARRDVQAMIIDLAINTKQLTAKDVAKWRTAWQQAIDVENPKRNQLLLIYDDAMIDLHLTGAIGNRKSETMAMGFKVVDKNGKEKPELTELLEAEWFKDFISFSLDSVFYGHSLIQFGNRISDPKLSFSHVEILPREHVIPEYNVFVREASDEWKKGFDYSKPPFSNWVIPVGRKNNLGLLLKTCPQTISKKNQFAFWDKFGEIFGMPIRVGTTNSRDSKDKNEIKSMLANMGSAAWGLFPEGTSLQIIGSSQGDAFNVYDKRIDRANSEMSKGILGNTMTMDNGASKSQGEVHERIQENLLWADKDFIRDVINNKLFPFLTNIHGFPLAGYRFDWDESIEYTPAQQLAIDTFLATYCDVDPAYFAERYNAPVKGMKQPQVQLPAKQHFDFF